MDSPLEIMMYLEADSDRLRFHLSHRLLSTANLSSHSNIVRSSEGHSKIKWLVWERIPYSLFEPVRCLFSKLQTVVMNHIVNTSSPCAYFPIKLLN